MAIIDMQMMRYINLLDRVAHVKTMKCYIYNNTIIFAVPKAIIGKAVGPAGTNLRRMSEQLGKKIKIISEADGALNNVNNIKNFVYDIVSPVQFNEIEFKDGMLVITAGMQSKAALIGRERRREHELQQIIKDTYGVEMRIM